LVAGVIGCRVLVIEKVRLPLVEMMLSTVLTDAGQKIQRRARN